MEGHRTDPPLDKERNAAQNNTPAREGKGQFFLLCCTGRPRQGKGGTPVNSANRHLCPVRTGASCCRWALTVPLQEWSEPVRGSDRISGRKLQGR